MKVAGQRRGIEADAQAGIPAAADAIRPKMYSGG
jgi:hypothetical protein